MNVFINGKETPATEGISLEQLLEILNIDRGKKGIAVAVNDTVKPRAAWALITLRAGDRIEVIRAVQGG